jgi:DNA-binding MarR family transcriptional regulator
LGKKSNYRNEIAAQAALMDRDLSGIRRALRKPLEAEVSRGDLTVPQRAAMAVIVRHHGISLKDLSREVSLAHSTVSGIVDRLEKRGMLVRRQDPADGRITRIHPSAEVEAFVRDRIPVLSQCPLEAALKRATDKERAAIAKSLQRLRELLEEA